MPNTYDPNFCKGPFKKVPYKNWVPGMGATGELVCQKVTCANFWIYTKGTTPNVFYYAPKRIKQIQMRASCS